MKEGGNHNKLFNEICFKSFNGIEDINAVCDNRFKKILVKIVRALLFCKVINCEISNGMNLLESQPQKMKKGSSE